jgi:hypothetical protein
MSNVFFQNLNEIAEYFRKSLETKKYILLYAYNGTGKTRLSMSFKDQGKINNERDTLYFNAFTEDLFYWDNDLDSDETRELRLNTNSKFFNGLFELEMESRIRPILHSYVNFDFKIKEKNISIKQDDQIYQQSITYVSFEREIPVGEGFELVENIKISRGEENLFIWCLFLSIVQLVLDKEEGSPYDWVKYIYIDDPISSLDDNNAIQVANHLGLLLKNSNDIKIVISSHHALFFNVMCNELKSALRYMLCSHDGNIKYVLKDTKDTPFFHHVSMLAKLNKAVKLNKLYTYHFSMLRNILEKSASFHGYKDLSEFIKREEDDTEGILHHRIIQLLNHGGYSHFEPVEMIAENKRHFKNILNKFMNDYGFNPELFPEESEETTV